MTFAKHLGTWVAVYVLAGALTFGWVAHRDCFNTPLTAGRTDMACSWAFGFGWPIYWPAKVSYELFRPRGT